MMRIFESLLEESNKKKFIKNWLGDDTEKIEEYDEIYEKYKQVFDNEVKKRGLNWQTSMTLKIFEEILDSVNDRKAKTELKKQNKVSGKSNFVSYVLANQDCGLTYLGEENNWDFFKINTWPGAMLADSPKASLNGDTGAKWCIGWRDPDKQKFDEYTRLGYDFVLITKPNKSNENEEEKYCIQILRRTGKLQAIWTPIDDCIEDIDKIADILNGFNDSKELVKKGILKGIDIIETNGYVKSKILNFEREYRSFNKKLYKTNTTQEIDASELKRIEFENVETIEKSFLKKYELIGVQEIILQNGLKKIEHGAFEDSFRLKFIELPDSVEEIGCEAFKSSSLEFIKLSQNLKLIDSGAFTWCRNLKHIEIPDSVEEISTTAFSYCRDLETVKLPSNLKAIYHSSFYWCENLRFIEIPNTVKSIGDFAFAACKSLRHIEIPDSVEILYENVFNYCRGLETIKLSSNLVKIGTSVFKDCENLKHIEIPEKLETITYKCFHNCKNLETVKFKLQSNLIAIVNYAFCDCENLKHIEIPNSVGIIGDNAFTRCTNLEVVKFQKQSKLYKIGNEAFFDCKNLKYIDIPDLLAYVSKTAFLSCDLLNKEIVATIEDRFF